MTTKKQKITAVLALAIAFGLGMAVMCGCSYFTQEKVAEIHKTVGTILDIAYTSATMCQNVPAGYELLNCKSVDSRGISLPVLPAGSKPRVGMDGVEHDVGNDVTCDLALRQAMNCGVDREAMIANVLNGYGTVAYSVGDGMPWSSPDMKVDYDPESAVKILADDGWVAGDDGVKIK